MIGQVAAFAIGQGFQDATRLGLGRENAFDGVGGIGAETHRPFQGRQEIDAGIGALQGEDLEGLLVAVTLVAEQAVEEAAGQRAEFGETLPQQGLLHAGIGGRPVLLVNRLLSGDAAWEQPMAGDLLDVGSVDDQFGLGDAHRQSLADVPPRDRVTVLLVGDEAFDVDDAIFDGVDGVGCGRQRDQVRPLRGVPIDGPLLRLAVNANIGHRREPLSRDFVEMIERREGAAIEQVRFDIRKMSFDLPLGLASPDATGPGRESVMGGEGQELGVVQRPLVAVPQDYHLHVVVEAGACDAAEVFKGADVFTQRGRQVLDFDEAEVLPARVAQQVAEQMDAAAAGPGEVEIVGAVIHLCLRPGVGLETHDRFARGPRPQLPDALAENRVAAGEAQPPQLFEQPRDRDVGVTRQPLTNRVVVGIERTGTSTRRCRRCGGVRPFRFPAADDRLHGLASQVQFRGNLSDRGAALMPTHNLVACCFGHDAASTNSTGQ